MNFKALLGAKGPLKVKSSSSCFPVSLLGNNHDDVGRLWRHLPNHLVWQADRRGMGMMRMIVLMLLMMMIEVLIETILSVRETRPSKQCKSLIDAPILSIYQYKLVVLV